MSNNNQFLSDYVYLAEASYANFANARLSNGTYFEPKVIDAMKNPKDQGGVGKPEQFAELVTQNYTVEAHWKDRAEKASDPESSFSATLFRGTDKSGQEGKYI